MTRSHLRALRCFACHFACYLVLVLWSRGGDAKVYSQKYTNPPPQRRPRVGVGFWLGGVLGVVELPTFPALTAAFCNCEEEEVERFLS